MSETGKKRGIARVTRLSKSELSNAEMIEGILAGDQLAASEFHSRYGARVNRWVWRLLGADAEHDDMVNQVFINILSSIGQIRKVESLGDWVDSVVIRTVRKEIRRRKYRRIMSPSTKIVEETLDRAHPNKQAHVRKFYEILGKMNADDRIVFVLRFLEGHSLGEVAKFGGYSLATAKRRLDRAKKEFKKRAVKDPIFATVLEGYVNAV